MKCNGGGKSRGFRVVTPPKRRQVHGPEEGIKEREEPEREGGDAFVRMLGKYEKGGRRWRQEERRSGRQRASRVRYVNPGMLWNKGTSGTERRRIK